jgi:predicted metal-dependent phosphoesterase TrpH
MPKNAPFTRLCGQFAALARPRRADLHVHSTASDGEYTPAQVVALARQAGLCAVAITDHDTLAGVTEAQANTIEGTELVPGVEISTRFANRELHLLGYCLQTDHEELKAALAAVCDSRRDRFRDFVSLLRTRELALPEDRVRLVEEATASLGRRHVAGLLIACGHARTTADAFQRFVNPLAGKVRPKSLIPLEDAIQLVHAAGGVASLAHPPSDFAEADFARLSNFGLDAIEVAYPWGRCSPVRRLRAIALQLGLATTGGSDCHGPVPSHRRIGSHAITSDELAALRGRIGCAVG